MVKKTANCAPTIYIITVLTLFIVFLAIGEVFIIKEYNLREFVSSFQDEIEDVTTKSVNNQAIFNKEEQPKPFVDKYITDKNHQFSIVFCSNFMDSRDPLKIKIQYNTLKRFAEFDRTKVKFVLFTTSPFWIQHANRFNIEVSDHFTTNQYGTPYFFPMMQFIETHYNSKFYGFLNGDILIHSSIIPILDTVWESIESGQLKSKVMITGRRHNMYIQLATNIGNTNDEIDSFIEQNIFKNEQFLPVSQDYFIITHDTFDYGKMLNVVIGRNDYDNYLVDYCYHRSKTISLLDGSNAIVALHQTESHGNFAGERVNPDKTWNHDIIKDKHDHDSVLFANWRLYLTHSMNIFVLPASPFDDNYTPKEFAFLKQHLDPKSDCFFLGNGYVSDSLPKLCSTSEIVYYDKWYSKKIDKYVTRPPLDTQKHHEEIRIIDVYNKTMIGECSRYHFYFDRLVELGKKFDVFFIEGGCRLHAFNKIIPYLKPDSLVVFRGYNLKKYDYSTIIDEAYTMIAELPPEESLYSVNIQGIRIYKHIPNKFITTSLPL